MQFYEDIPRLYTALAEWGACMLYLYIDQGKTKKLPFLGKQRCLPCCAEYVSYFYRRFCLPCSGFPVCLWLQG